jgi:hypothetical protein
MPEGTPFGPGIASIIAYLHGCTSDWDQLDSAISE